MFKNFWIFLYISFTFVQWIKMNPTTNQTGSKNAKSADPFALSDESLLKEIMLKLNDLDFKVTTAREISIRENIDTRMILKKLNDTLRDEHNRREAEMQKFFDGLNSKINYFIDDFNYKMNTLIETIDDKVSLKMVDDVNREFLTQMKSFNYAQPFSINPKNCHDALSHTNENGIYTLSPPNLQNTFDAYCLRHPENNTSWTIIQRRQDGSVNFQCSWNDYKNGFGALNGEHWLGLEKIYAMTNAQRHELWIEMKDFQGEKRFAKYDDFKIGNGMTRYELQSLGQYTGNAGDSLNVYTRGGKFGTFDLEYSSKNCATVFKGAWWQTADGCYSSLNGEYNNTNLGEGINWLSWHGYYYSLKYVHMAIRPYDEK